ncbi:SMP-30/gluconolactonase/LRE family protein [Kitasatospora sp. NPDC057198]|uniref:SMP-30/gluconolactonase/LRE family protein n=1 Tax=Kitasatospora sp. NPDC057198 TaxID=3346046 RepID=UPI003636CA75
MREDHWRPVGPARHQLAEGARWHDGRLYYTDLLRGTLHCWDPEWPEHLETLADLGVPLGAAAPVQGRPGEWIAAAGDGIVRLTPGGAPPRWLARPEAGAGRPMRMNDAGCDPAGRFWATSMDVDAAEGAGSLYRTDPDGGVHRVLDGLTVPNGPVFSPDGTVLYLADSARGEITAHPLDPTGQLGPARLLVRLPPAQGRPDGMAVDDRGRLWVAAWGAGTVRCHAPDGRLLGASAVGTPHVSSVAFGGGLMFATTARHRLAEPDAQAGAVLARRSEVSALPVLAYREDTWTRNGKA